MRDEKFSSIGRDLTQEIDEAKTYKTKRRIDSIAIHCSFSPQGRGDNAFDIDKWHLEKKWSGIGYHYVVLEDGTIQKGRWVDSPGAHVRGYNRNTIAICRIGGMKEDGSAIDDSTPQQIYAIRKLAQLLARMYDLPNSKILGHNEYPGVNKACPLMKMNLIRNIV